MVLTSHSGIVDEWCCLNCLLYEQMFSTFSGDIFNTRHPF